MIKFSQKEWRLFRRLQKKHKVSTEFLRYNLANIQKMMWYETWPRIIIKRFAIRKRNRIFLVHHRLRRVLFDQANRKIIKRMRQNIRQWSKRMVAYQKRTQEPNEYVEETICEEKSPQPTVPVTATATAPAPAPTPLPSSNTDDVSKQLKEQLELLKSGRRQQPFINAKSLNSTKEIEAEYSASNTQKSDPKINNNPSEKTPMTTTSENVLSDEDESVHSRRDWQDNLESTPEKQLTTAQANVRPIKQLATDEKTEKSQNEDDALTIGQQNSEKTVKTGLNFLDMLMSKVNSAQATTNTMRTETKGLKSSSSSDVYHQHEHSLDSTDGFLGFDDTERIPGMLMTPIVPNSTRNNKNSIFISEKLNEYMRENDLETNYNIDEDKSIIRVQAKPADWEGLMTPKTQPPPFDMPAVPDNLLRFRTVAERKSYLQKFAKNSRLSIINNEASIYRELQKRIRYQKCKPNSQQLSAQSANSSMSFTRNGWYAASFINTEFNKYYYQMLDVDCGKYKLKLKGVRGNNDEFRKKPYRSRVKNPSKECPPLCMDEDMWHDFKSIKTVSPRTKKLNKQPLPSVFKPCPLSHKALQKPLDDDAAALLLAGGSMAVVRMPTVELEVFPECGRPLNEIAKRYLQYILPHHDISREWAEFSVSTLKLPGSLKDAVQAAADSIPRKSFTFLIPYLNDRNHVLVRRVVDRSEKLDESFEHSSDSELVPKADFTFHQNLDQNDEILMTCADVVCDMINTVAISCSENSFIKADPDVICVDGTERFVKSPTSLKNEKLARPPSAASNSEAKKQSKQKRVLSELKRLNATIIDAAVKPEKDKKPCSLEFCAMGCVCDSLTEESHVREHCGKTKCMWGCSCKTSNQSRIMRLETDGRTITTEDAFMLRRKATARLARMEKEFTSTVVLTENETLLINETNNDKKRRCTKMPKRYEYYEDETDDEARKASPNKTALTTIDNEKNLAVEIKEIREPVYIQDTILEQLKHCTVNLVRLPNMENVAPWCMIHQLYKCFCKGKSLEGKPVIIEKDENNTTIEHGEDEQKLEMDYKVNTKARYTFEKVEKKKYSKDDDQSDDNDIHTKYESRKHKKEEADKKTQKSVQPECDKSLENDNAELGEEKEDSLLEVGRIEKERPKRSLEEVRERFYASRPECCRRQIPIPRRMFLYCNRKRRLNVLKFIKENETEKTRLLLNEHVMRSVYYHKTDVEKARRLQETLLQDEKEKEQKTETEGTKQREVLLESSSCGKSEETKLPLKETVCNRESDKNEDIKPQLTEIVDLLDDDEENPKSLKEQTNCINDNSSKQTASAEESNLSSHDSVITVKKFGTLSSINVGDCKLTSQTSNSSNNHNNNTVAERQEMMLPKISNCFSLNANANTSKPLNSSPADVEKLQQHLADLTSATTVNSTAFTTTSMNSTQNTELGVVALTSMNESSSSAIDTQFPASMDSESVRDVYNSVIRTMNTLVSKKMQDVDFALRRESHIIPAPNADILCIMKWSNFLDAFCQGFAFIWQVKSKEGTYLVATIRNMMPMICEAMGVVNITALKPERVPLMGRMLLHNVRNEHTTKLAVVMQGKLSYWVVKGFLKADPAMACNKPTPETHPSLTKKINVLCTSLVKQRQKEEKKKEQLGTKRSNMTNNLTKVAQMMVPTSIATGQHQTAPVTAAQTTLPLNSTATQSIIATAPTSLPRPLAPKPAPYQQHQGGQMIAQKISTLPSYHHQPQQQQILESHIQKSFSNNATPLPATLPTKQSESSINESASNARKRKSTGDIVSNGITSTKMDSYAKMNTNIEFRKVTPLDINEIHLPEIHKRNHKWLVLDLHNDFSHIFVPDFRDLVSLDRIQKVINFAKQKNKIVKLQFFQNAPFDAFVTPRSGRKIYFGPLNMEMKPPTLILLQSVDGQMMLRELYQMKHNIQKTLGQRTKAFWLLQMNGQTHFEVEPNQSNVESSTITTPDCSNNVVDQLVVEDDDEDCMIVDEVTQNTTTTTTEQQQQPQPHDGRFNFTIGSMPNDTSVTIVPQTNSLPGPPPIQTLINSSNTGETPTSLLKIANTNTIIKPLMQMPLVNPAPPSLLTMHSNTLITGITPISLANVNSISTSTTTNTNLTPTSIMLHSNAVVTGITTTAPQDAAYGSTIFISPSPASTKVTTKLNTPRPALATSGNKSLTNQISVTAVQQEIIANPAAGSVNDISYRPAPIAKRRRVSVVCHNAYDRTSQNIAVNAVINKILPDNIQDIQVNQSLETLKAVSTIGSTTITKIADSTSEKQCSSSSSAGSSSTNQEQINSSKPLVFDVSFVDGVDDEPAASIVIKPTASPVKVPPTATLKPPTSSTITSSSSSIAQRIENSIICLKNSRNVPYKVIKIPNSTATAGGGQAQLLNKMLYTKANTTVTAITNTAAAAGSNSTSTFVNNQTPGNNSSLLPKKILNTSNPIKITGITTIPAPVNKLLPTAIITPGNVNTTTPIRIAPKPAPSTINESPTNSPSTVRTAASTLNRSTSNSSTLRSITITSVATSLNPITTHTNSFSKSVPLGGSNAKTLTTSASQTPKSSCSTSSSTPFPTTQSPIVPNNRQLATTIATTSTSTNNAEKALNSGLAITSVQSFGTAMPQRNNKTNIGSISNVQSTISPAQQRNTMSNSSNDKSLTSLESSTIALASTQQNKNNEDTGTGGRGVDTNVPLPPHIQYGYIVSPIYSEYKFVAKRVSEEFYVKVPSVGILKLMGLTAVHNYLNKHMLKMSEENKRPGDWKFLAASKAVQMQNHQKSLLVRKTKPGTESKLPTRGNSSKTDVKKSQKVVSVTSMSEPILIDD